MFESMAGQTAGLIAQKVRDLFRGGDNSFLDYEDRKRKRMDKSVESDNVIATDGDGDELACSELNKKIIVFRDN